MTLTDIFLPWVSLKTERLTVAWKDEELSRAWNQLQKIRGRFTNAQSHIADLEKRLATPKGEEGVSRQQDWAAKFRAINDKFASPFASPDDQQFSRLSRAYARVYIHPHAVIDDTNQIAPGCKIWSGAVVRAGTILGEDVSVAANAILEGCEIGDGTHINPFVHMGPGVIVGKRCFIAAQVVIANDGWPSVDREANGGWHPQPGWITVRIGDDTSICTAAIIMPGITIGNRCMIAAQACVTRDVPDDHLWTRDGRIKSIDPSLIRRMRTMT